MNNLNQFQVQDDKKIMIVGLDNSGKSSILLSLREGTNLLSLLSLKPTKGVTIESFKNSLSNMIIWEFGGQDQYRQQYLENFNRYFNEVDNLIYVIDIQDVDRQELSLTYFKDIIDLLNKNKVKVDISIYLHKYDPNLTIQEKFKNIDRITTPGIIKKIQELIPSGYNYKIFKTSIYTIFEKSLIIEAS
jgi:GTPase SAR1 family protein